MATARMEHDVPSLPWSVHCDEISFDFAPAPPARAQRAWERAPVVAHDPRRHGQKIWKRVGTGLTTVLHGEAKHDKENYSLAQSELELGGIGERKKRRIMGMKVDIRDAGWGQQDVDVENAPALSTEAEEKSAKIGAGDELQTDDALRFVPRKRGNDRRIIKSETVLRDVSNEMGGIPANTMVDTVDHAKPERRRKSMRRSLRQSLLPNVPIAAEEQHIEVQMPLISDAPATDARALEDLEASDLSIIFPFVGCDIVESREKDEDHANSVPADALAAHDIDEPAQSRGEEAAGTKACTDIPQISVENTDGDESQVETAGTKTPSPKTRHLEASEAAEDMPACFDVQEDGPSDTIRKPTNPATNSTPMVSLPATPTSSSLRPSLRLAARTSPRKKAQRPVVSRRMSMQVSRADIVSDVSVPSSQATIYEVEPSARKSERVRLLAEQSQQNVAEASTVCSRELVARQLQAEIEQSTRGSELGHDLPMDQAMAAEQPSEPLENGFFGLIQEPRSQDQGPGHDDCPEYTPDASSPISSPAAAKPFASALVESIAETSASPSAQKETASPDSSVMRVDTAGQQASTGDLISTIESFSMPLNPQSEGSSSYDHEDTDLLRNFLSKVQASKAAKAASKKRKSLPHSPLQLPLGDSERLLQSTADAEKAEAASTVDASRTSPLKRKRDADVPGEDSTEAPSGKAIRRSTRTRLPVKASAGPLPGVLSFIPMRRLASDPEATVTLKKSEEKELAALTRTNTRKNKGGALPAPVILGNKRQGLRSAADDHEEDKTIRLKKLRAAYDEKVEMEAAGMINRSKNKKGHNVDWSEDLVRFQQAGATATTETKTTASSDTAVETKLPRLRSRENRSSRSATGGDAPKVAGPAATDDETHEHHQAPTTATAVKVTPRSKIALGMAANGTPAPKRRMRSRA